jgi:hypothetical protein
MADSSGNAEQTRVVAEQVADTAISRFVARHPEVTQAEIPAPLKWASGIIAALLVIAVAGTATWLVSTVSEMMVTLARVDERMGNQETSRAAEIDEVKRRLTIVESRMARGDHE